MPYDIQDNQVSYVNAEYYDYWIKSNTILQFSSSSLLKAHYLVALFKPRFGRFLTMPHNETYLKDHTYQEVHGKFESNAQNAKNFWKMCLRAQIRPKNGLFLRLPSSGFEKTHVESAFRFLGYYSRSQWEIFYKRTFYF